MQNECGMNNLGYKSSLLVPCVAGDTSWVRGKQVIERISEYKHWRPSYYYQFKRLANRGKVFAPRKLINISI